MKQKQKQIPPLPKPSGTANSDFTEKQTPTSVKSSVIIILMAIASFGAGFILVHLTLPDTSITPAATTKCKQSDNLKSTHSDSVDSTQPDNQKEQPDNNISDEATALPEVIPGPTPDGIKINGAALYLKCSDSNGSESKSCDQLTVLEKRMNTRLYVIDKCKKQFAGDATGKLSLGANLDFNDNTIKFWSGPSSTLENAKAIGNCVRLKLAGIPIYGIKHNYKKYRIFFTVDFYDVKAHERELAKKRRRGREVQVIKDRVNVREEPVTGASLGRISSDSKVIFLKKNATRDWCQVLTPNNREGWMICEALQL